MCEAYNYSKKILKLFNEVEETYKGFVEELSNLDKQQSDILHFIEEGNFNAYQGFLYSKKIQEIRQKRRNIKLEVATMSNLVNGFVRKYGKDINQISNIIKGIDKHSDKQKYTPRVLTKEAV